MKILEKEKDIMEDENKLVYETPALVRLDVRDNFGNAIVRGASGEEENAGEDDENPIDL